MSIFLEVHVPPGHKYGVTDAPHLIGYARVSTGGQDHALQVDALTAAGVAADDIYFDTASGKHGTRRPGLTAALKDAREGDILVVWKLDRLSRSLEELVVTMRRLREKGANLRILTGLGQMDTSTPSGTLIFQIFGALAEFERALIVERTQAGLAAARARGRVGGRKPTYGPAVREEVERRLRAGEQVKDIAKALKVSRSTIHKWFPGGTPGITHDPAEGK